ncbi:AaceriAAL045Cp [[Ashbya] aceris (nom. inval.)]|nr:AaceriAAL045Cp [[Ashbya] aceris (nom. inval.)]
MERGTTAGTGEAMAAELQAQAAAVARLNERLRTLERLLPEQDDAVAQTLDTLTATAKNLAHNQRALETKLDDLLKNQTNTDVAINELSGRLEGLMGLFGNGGLGLVVGPPGGAQCGAAPPASRGPGRPKKNQTFVTTNLPNGASYSRIQLPLNNINIPKSRKHFTDPNQEPPKKETTSTQSVAPDGALPPPRRRGRPPKNRKNLATAAASSGPAAAASGGQVSSTSSKRASAEPTGVSAAQLRKANSEEAPVRGRRAAALSGSAVPTRGSRRRSTRARRQKNFYDEESDESEELSNSEGSEESDLDKEEDDNGNDASYEESSSARKPAQRIPKLKEKDKVKHEDEDEDDLSESPSSLSKTRRQLELERRRDPREKMLVSMKYSDRDKAKSFMESNKDLLKAMKEEERKKRMTAINYEPIYNNSLQQTIRQVQSNAAGIIPPLSSSTLVPIPQSSDSNRTITADASTLSIPNTEPRRMGILSMLNSHEPSPSQTAAGPPLEVTENTTASVPPPPIAEITATTTPVHSPSSSSHKRSVNDTDPLEDTPIKRQKNSPNAAATSIIPQSAPTTGYTTGYTTMTTTMTPSSELSKNNAQAATRGRPSNASNGSDNSAALLMASPIELVCKDGYFYRRNDLTTPITTGNYLGMKFKNKEEELIKMTMHEEDYAELTRQDRINAYFMKPDIDIETEYACQVLSNVTLTEKYVNSLEYFLMEFRWENRLVSLGLKLRESKRTWQRRKALFALFEFWRDKSREKRGFRDFTILHAVKEMENYRVFINRSVSWFYNHITLLKMILFDLCDNTDTQWREWMFPKGSSVPVEAADAGITKQNINQFIDSMLTLDFLEDGTENLHTKSSAA